VYSERNSLVYLLCTGAFCSSSKIIIKKCIRKEE
jgi:hypothetical protein